MGEKSRDFKREGFSDADYEGLLKSFAADVELITAPMILERGVLLFPDFKNYNTDQFIRRMNSRGYLQLVRGNFKQFPGNIKKVYRIIKRPE